MTHSLPTLACNAINMLAGGNALVCNPHPSGARIACKGVHLFNEAINKAIGIKNGFYNAAMRAASADCNESLSRI